MELEASPAQEVLDLASMLPRNFNAQRAEDVIRTILATACLKPRRFTPQPQAPDLLLRQKKPEVMSSSKPRRSTPQLGQGRSTPDPYYSPACKYFRAKTCVPSPGHVQTCWPPAAWNPNSRAPSLRDSNLKG